VTRRLLLLAASAGAALVAVAWRLTAAGPALLPHATAARSQVEPAPLCPWREPQQDLHRFFPGATGSHEETRILSQLRVALIHELGRPLTAEEMLLRPYGVVRGAAPLGSVLLHRVKGEFGAIELVLAVQPDGRVRGLRLQRQREPVAAVLTSSHWLNAFRGKTAESPLRVGEDLPAVPTDARRSAEAIASGVRTSLILLRASEPGKRERVEHDHGRRA
jgi:hypothetical protein